MSRYYQLQTHPINKATLKSIKSKKSGSQLDT